ncbi:hypothetical protein [Butyricimonas paravirosa]|jgi:hypothetical protein|uniref:hypothetical protein n=1 Tax=Butyricimonas paravirosa TaxID=1472417 RepID=UPI002057F016|nr:hypothetical protein [Butyricimonas paravirosa]DAN51078.1 MAG TPA: hypothetical protein [Caudoviricetes sp.]
MKNLVPGVWMEDILGVQIVVNENLKTISTILPGNKEVKVDYDHVPTIDDYSCFRTGVEEAVFVLNKLNIS